MTKKGLFLLWGGLFSVCALGGFIPEPEGALRVLLTALSIAFFLLGVLLLWRWGGDRPAVLLVRNLSALSLGLTLVLLILNFLTVLSGEAAGTVLYYILVVVSSPMVCSGCWAMSLFFWACLLMTSLSLLKKKKED